MQPVICHRALSLNSCQVHTHVRACCVWASVCNWLLGLMTPCPFIYHSFSQPGTTHRCMAAGVLPFLYYNALQGKNCQLTHSLCPSASSSLPSRYQNIQSSCPSRTTAVLSNRESWPNTSTTSSVTSCWKARWTARPPSGFRLLRWAVQSIVLTLPHSTLYQLALQQKKGLVSFYT